MHFVGPDQLHGFEEGSQQTFTLLILAGHQITVRLESVLIGGITTWGLSLALVLQRFQSNGVWWRSRPRGGRKIYDLARGHDERPWCLTVSFAILKPTLLAENIGTFTKIVILLPSVVAMPYELHDPHSKPILMQMIGEVMTSPRPHKECQTCVLCQYKLFRWQNWRGAWHLRRTNRKLSFISTTVTCLEKRIVV